MQYDYSSREETKEKMAIEVKNARKVAGSGR
jgi:hypothetical protein